MSAHRESEEKGTVQETTGSWKSRNLSMLLWCCSLSLTWRTLKWFICLTGSSPSPREVKAGTQGRNLTMNRQRDTVYWLAPWGLFSLLSNTTRLSSQGEHGPQCIGAFHINHQLKKCSTGLSTVQVNGKYFSVKVPSSQVNLVCIKSTEQTSIARETLQKVVWRSNLWRKTDPSSWSFQHVFEV